MSNCLDCSKNATQQEALKHEQQLIAAAIENGKNWAKRTGYKGNNIVVTKGKNGTYGFRTPDEDRSGVTEVTWVGIH